MVLLATDTSEDGRSLDRLEEEITALAAHIHAATHKLLTLIAEFDRRGGWKVGGHRTCAHWLSFRTGIDLGAAREKVRAARALVGLPETNASMARGDLSFSKVRALTRVMNQENEGELLEVAKECTTAQLERVVRSMRRGSREDEAALERERYESRSLSVFADYEGMYVVRGRLPAEIGALLMRAVEAASDALYRNKEDTGIEVTRAAAQRRADALGLLAERALAAGFGGLDRRSPEAAADLTPEKEGVSSPTEEGMAPQTDERGSSPAAEGVAPRTDERGSSPAAKGVAPPGTGQEASPRAEDRASPISGARADRYQVVLYVEPETLRSNGEGGRSELEDGTRVSAETSQRISCDAGLVRIQQDGDGSILDVGRRTRTIPPSIRRALDARDRGCRFPGCGSRFAEGHHIRHWADGGETKLDNLVLLCRFHHRLVHEEGWKVRWSGDEGPLFYDPRGKQQSQQPPRIGPATGQGVEARPKSPGIGPGSEGAERARPLRRPVKGTRALAKTPALQESMFG